MIRSRIIFKVEAADGTDMVSSTLEPERIATLLRIADRNDDSFITVPTARDSVAIVPIADIAFVRSV